MWIIPVIIALLIAIVAIILSLPVKVILKNEEHDPLVLRYKFLWMTFGEDSDADSDENPIIKALKSASGLDRLEKNNLETDLRSGGLKKTISENYAMLRDLLKELTALLKRATITKLHITIRCTGDSPDQAAIHYGQCCAVTYGLLNVLRQFIKIRKRGCKIDIGCDFAGDKPVFRYELIVSVRVVRVLTALWRIVMAQAKRMEEKEKNQPK